MQEAARLRPVVQPSPGCSPMFVLPVFRGPNAFENFMVQCQAPVVLFTTLEQYKRWVAAWALGCWWQGRSHAVWWQCSSTLSQEGQCVTALLLPMPWRC